jgi:hypothetical protein
MFFFYYVYYISESALTIMRDIGEGDEASVEGDKASVKGDEASAVVFVMTALMKPLSKSKAHRCVLKSLASSSIFTGIAAKESTAASELLSFLAEASWLKTR